MAMVRIAIPTDRFALMLTLLDLIERGHDFAYLDEKLTVKGGVGEYADEQYARYQRHIEAYGALDGDGGDNHSED